MKVLGLDLGIGSIGWCLIEVDENRNPIRILGMGCRIIGLSPDETTYFEKGKGETINSQRTSWRTARKGNWRYKMRRALLKSTLSALGMIDKDSETQLNKLSPLQLWQLRSDAATRGNKLSLLQLGRVLLHLNQKRGYRHAKTDGNDSKQTQYVAQVNKNFADITGLGLTIGQYHYSKLKGSEIKTPSGNSVVAHMIKNTVYPRQAYMAEFDRIMEVQSAAYPDILKPDVINKLREIIFFQRPLKSCKHLVSFCEFEKHEVLKSDGSRMVVGPKVAPRTSPISQVARLYEAINNIRLINSQNRNNVDVPATSAMRKSRYEYTMTGEERQRLFDYLNTHDKLTGTTILKLLGLKKSDGFVVDKAVGKGIKGNETYVKISDALGDYPAKDELLRFDLDFIDSDIVDEDTGEVVKVLSPDCIKQPLYQLWHLLYSVNDRSELANALERKFGIVDPQIIERLCSIDFVTPGFSNRSAKFMRKLIPLYIDGLNYSEAATAVGVNHSDSLSAEENESRQLDEHIKLLAKNSLRQPLVEKVLNQMINVVNALIDKHGQIDEARVELARQLKQSKDERIKASDALAKREKENKEYEKLIAEYGIRPSRNRIQKYRMWRETGETCMYCGQIVGANEFLESHGFEVEHIIPRSLYFDDSFSNKTCSCRKCNREKNNRTAYDYICSLGDEARERYEKRVDALYAEKKISRRKHDYLLMKQSDIPVDFIDRDLRQSQYIAKKAREVLRQSIRNVWASSGAVTDFFRHAWGYDTILHDLNVEKYELAGLVHNEQFEHKGQVHTRAVIDNWSKRLDHRHHAIDAVTIALTSQGYVQRLNNLTSQHGNLFDEVTQSDAEFKKQHSLLSQWAASRPHFSVAEVANKTAEIAISIKRALKLVTPGKRYIRRKGKTILAQDQLQIPRGSLHEESVYGRIRVYDGLKSLSYAFKNLPLVISDSLRMEIERRIDQVNGDVSVALRKVKKDPLTRIVDGLPTKVESVACWREEFVKKYPIGDLKLKKIDDIVDQVVREAIRQRFEQCGNNEREFKNSLENNPLLHPATMLPIKTVRRFTGCKPTTMVGARKDGAGQTIGYAKTGSNHHVAIYLDENGVPQTMVVSYWMAVLRKINGIQPIVKDPSAAWDEVMTISNESTREQIASSLPDPRWKFVSSMMRNEMFVLGMDDDEFNDALRDRDEKKLCDHLYRVQKLSDNYYVFRRHTETSVDDSKEALAMKSYYLAASYGALVNLKPRKVAVSLVGEITLC